MIVRRLVGARRLVALSAPGLLVWGLFWAWTSLSLAQERRLSTYDPGGAPSILISEPIHDFGETDEGARVSHQFSVENKGGGELIIYKVSPD